MEKTIYDKIFHNKYRVEIWDLCKEKPRSFSELKNILNISTGALHHNLKIMENAGILNKEEIKDGEKYRRGKEVKISVNEKKFNELFKQETNKAREHWMKTFPLKLEAEILTLIKKNQPVDSFGITKLLTEKGYGWEVETFLKTSLITEGKVNFIVSPKGEEIIKNNLKRNKSNKDDK